MLIGAIALVLAATPTRAQTCTTPVPMLGPIWGGVTQGTTCGHVPLFWMTPHPVVVHSFWGGPQLAGTLSFSTGFNGAELLLIDGRSGEERCHNAEPIELVIPGQLLTVTGLPYGLYYVAITSFEPNSQPVTCGEYVIGHWLWDVDEIFTAGFERP